MQRIAVRSGREVNAVEEVAELKVKYVLTDTSKSAKNTQLVF